MITKDLRETMRLIESSDYFWLGLTLSAYLLGLVLNRRLKNPLINPLLVGILFLTAILYRLETDTSRYAEAVRPLVLLMTPATICLAVPLYRQLPLLRKHAGAVIEKAKEMVKEGFESPAEFEIVTAIAMCVVLCASATSFE